MEISITGLNLIKNSEGFHTTIYADLRGYPCIGWGHKLQPGQIYPGGITQAQGDALLQEDVKAAETFISNVVKVTLTQGQFDALVSFTYNVKPNVFSGSRLRQLLNAGQYGDAGQQLLLWDKAGKPPVVVPGLKTRREAEFALWNSVAS